MENKNLEEIKSFEEFGDPAAAQPTLAEPTKTPPATIKQEIVKTAPAPVQVSARDGVLMPQNFEEGWRLACALHKSATLPSVFNTPEKVFAGMQLCYELGLTPMIGMRQMFVMNGTPNIYGDLPLSLAMRSGKIKSMKEWWFDKDGKEICAENQNLKADVFGATCVIQRTGDFAPVTRTFTMDDAKKADLLKKGPWQSYTKRMLQCRTRAWALKDSVPDVLNGLSILEYDHNTTAEYEGPQTGGMTTTSASDPAQELNNRFGKKAAPAAPIDAELSETVN